MTRETARPVVFGEVLFDHFPDGSRVLGGAPFNVAWHLQAFGLEPLVVSRVGDDPEGQEVQDAMVGWGMDLAGLQEDDSHSTGAVQITIDAGQPNFDILPHQAYDFIDPSLLPARTETSVLYHGSLALRGEVARRALEELRARSSAPAFMDVNLRPPWWDAETVSSLMREAKWVKLNDDELRKLTAESDRLQERAAFLQKDCGLELVVVTRGAAGALAHTADAELLDILPTSAEKVVDTVGAGDAFASVTILGLSLGWQPRQTLERAQAFASAIVGIRGATVSDPAFYDPFLADWNLS